MDMPEGTHQAKCEAIYGGRTDLYFGVRQECLRRLEGHTIQQKAGGGKDDIISECDPFGENLITAILPRSGWTYHQDEINNQAHQIIRQSGMVSQVKVKDYFIRKLQGMAITPNDIVPILNKHLRGDVPDGRQLWIAINKFPGGIDQFTEVKVIHNVTVHYRRHGVRDEQHG